MTLDKILFYHVETSHLFYDEGFNLNSFMTKILNDFMQNIYNQEKPITYHGEIKVAPAVLLDADKAAFFGCGFVSVQDTIADLNGRHYFRKCDIKGAIDFIWGGGQSTYQVITLIFISHSL